MFTPQKEIEDVLQQRLKKGNSVVRSPRLPLRHKQMLRGFYVANTGEYVSYYVGTLKTFNVKNGYGFIEPGVRRSPLLERVKESLRVLLESS